MCSMEARRHAWQVLNRSGIYRSLEDASRRKLGCCAGSQIFWRQVTGGPDVKDLSAIPFQVSRENAANAFKEYFQGHPFAARPSSGLQKIKEAFLPFWAVSAHVSVQLLGARIGFDRWVTRYDHAQKRLRPELETHWQWVTFQRAFWEQRYTSHEEGMQIYASYKYPRKEINPLRPGAAVQVARRFEPKMVVSEHDESTRRVGPFQMKPAVALRFADEWMRDQEERRARNFVKSSYRCDRVDTVRLDIQLSNVRASPLLFPIFIFSSRHFGDKIRTYVSGVSASLVSGTRPLDEIRVGVAGGILSGLGLAFTWGITSLSPFNFWVWGLAFPGLLAGFGARYYTKLWREWNMYWQNKEEAAQEEENARSSWNPEWIRDYARLEDEYRERSEQYEQNYSSGASRGTSQDPQGFYDTLGVSKTATKQEIQAAYRGLVLRYHPDRVAENEKKSANKKFQQIQEAYTVLRDAKKRQMYDSGSSF